jgi:DNA topoisomerase-1
MKEIDAWAKKLKKDSKAIDKTGKLPKTGEACQAKITKMKQWINLKEFELKNKKDNS